MFGTDQLVWRKLMFIPILPESGRALRADIPSAAALVASGPTRRTGGRIVMTAPVDRRSFLRRSALLGGAAAIAPSLVGLISCSEPVAPFDANGVRPSSDRGHTGGYGELEPVEKYPEISIPRGFHAERLSVRGDLMDDGLRVPQALDGMGAFAMGGHTVRLVRNHELRDAASVATPFAANPYDAKGPAGTTTLEVELGADGAATLSRQFASLSGTFVNCAGGITPWGSWITSEETVAGTGAGWAKNHGYNFEVPASANGPVTPVPLKDMGRFTHEAVAVDPATGIVYETEDRNPSGFYRFIPNVPGHLDAGGTLEMLAVQGAPQYDTRRGQTVGVVHEAIWMAIAHPNSDAPTISSGFVFDQASCWAARSSPDWKAAGMATAASTSTRRAAARRTPARSSSTRRPARTPASS